MSLRESVCVVTGSSSGIGRALTLALAGEGAHVWAIGRNRARLDALVAEAAQAERRVVPLVADFERHEDIEAAGREVLVGGDRIDLLVHSAGAVVLGDLASVSPAELDRQYDVNLRAPVVLTQMLLPALRRSRGQVLFMNSLAASKASATNAIYAATKAGLKAFADGLREEVKGDGVRVITVHTGRTATPLQEALHKLEGRPYRPELLLQPNDVVDVALAALSLSASGEVTDVSVRPMVKVSPA